MALVEARALVMSMLSAHSASVLERVGSGLGKLIEAKIEEWVRLEKQITPKIVATPPPAKTPISGL